MGLLRVIDPVRPRRLVGAASDALDAPEHRPANQIVARPWGLQANSPGPPWMRMQNQTRPGSRVVTSWTSHVLPSGSLNEQNDP
jgi:hypothetical protein